MGATGTKTDSNRGCGKGEQVMSWPTVDPEDDGIRPAGASDECFYCHQKVGEPHQRDCVIVTKRVRVRYLIDVDIERL